MDLMQGEEVIWSGHPTWRGTLGWYVRAVPVVLIPIVVVYVLRALDLGSGISLAKWWLINRKGNDWQSFDVDGGMKALGIYDPDKVELVAVEMPAEKPDAPKLPSVAEILKLTGDAQRGLQLANGICSVCHRIGDVGTEFGPALTTFGKQQTREVIIQAIAEPSATISHGFEGSEVKTKDGLTITGMVLSTGDPLLIKCMGGLVQTVPQSRISSVKKMSRSLMYTPQFLGVDAQGIADITAYLQSR